ncbi:uncharacterized protein [Diabrotica undecimpunctata]|uniref:uncharacterized protein n=1 Tax=Diabrotica undecimpunctata TaxID=50387 RepID=UPI003B63F49A
MAKLRFEFTVKSLQTDTKTNIITITTIENEENEIFAMPHDMQNISYHEKIQTTAAFQKVKRALTKRGTTRKVWIADENILQVYMDKDGNIQFNDFLLEQQDIQRKESLTSTTGIPLDALEQILERVTKSNEKQCIESFNKNKISEQFVIEKFTGKNVNVLQWMETFENECTRLQIDQNTEKIELLRLFLEGSCVDWYRSMLIKYSINSNWDEWKNKFCDTYADKGWTPVRYAFQFKYKNGSLLEYALKKERLILQINKSLDKKSMIDLIAIGLPNYIADRIDRDTLKETEDLFNEIRGLEHLIKIKTSKTNKKCYFEKKQACKICEKEGKGLRYHLESSCWFRSKRDISKNQQVRTVNNHKLEIELNETNPKNC